MARFAPSAEISPREHHDWASKMWRRMDRDGSECITRRELDCEEFRSILRSILAPQTKVGFMGGAAWERSEMNMNQAIHLCLRKADLNSDGTLSFEEFKSFALCLRQGHALHTAGIVFALFDLDCDGRVDEDEFREVYRFFLGNTPTEADFQAEWQQLDATGRGFATRGDFVRWLQTTSNPVFRRHAPPAADASAASGGGGDECSQGSAEISPMASSSGGRRRRTSAGPRPAWNQRFTGQKNPNGEMPVGRRNYFMRPQSLPDLGRHFDTHKGFKANKEKFLRPEPPKPVRVLSTDTGTCFSFNPGMGLPGGIMRNTGGEVTPWKDHWQTPLCARKRVKPGTFALRTPGQPPNWMFAGDGEAI